MAGWECQNAEAAALYEAEAADRVWGAFVDAGCVLEGQFKFASMKDSDPPATVKIDGEKLYKEGNERPLGVVLGAVAGHPCIQEADLITYVPEGPRRFAHLLGGVLGKKVIDIERVPRAKTRYAFRFVSEKAQERAQAALKPRICEDIVSTLGSVAAVRNLFLPEQEVHAIAQLLRGEPNPDYQNGLADHYLARRSLPLLIKPAEVHQQFGFWPTSTGRKRGLF